MYKVVNFSDLLRFTNIVRLTRAFSGVIGVKDVTSVRGIFIIHISAYAETTGRTAKLCKTVSVK